MKNHLETTPTANERLTELQALFAEAEGIISQAPSEQSHAALSDLRARLGAAQERFSDFYEGARKKVVAGAKYTDTTIRENPYQSMAIAAGVGILIGVLLGRRSK